MHGLKTVSRKMNPEPGESDPMVEKEKKTAKSKKEENERCETILNADNFMIDGKDIFS